MARGSTSRRFAGSDIEDDDDSQLSKPATVKKERANAKNAPKVPDTVDDSDDDDDDDEDEPIDLRGLAEDWEGMAKHIEPENAYIGDTAAAFAEHLPGDESCQGLEALDQIMKDAIDVSNQMKANQKVLDDIYQEVAQGNKVSDAVRRYEDGVQASLAEYASKTTRQKYAKDIQYVKYKQGIWDVDEPGQPMPPLSELIPKEDGDDSDDDDDIEMGGVTQDYKCPLSLLPLDDPWTSEVCGHSFSGAAIRAFFGNSRGPKKCPAAGCTRSFELRQCKADSALAKKVKAILKRQERRDDDSDADEVID
ncbi:hypothetical protein ONZ45_g277 [Pleurotus djamor]|nr:hypothetical protein ONZ45_g277 [Pleurotus djamor]